MTQNDLNSAALGLAFNAAGAEISGKTSYKWSNKLAEQNQQRALAYFDHTFNKQAAYQDPSYQRMLRMLSGSNPSSDSPISSPNGGSLSSGPSVSTGSSPFGAGSLNPVNESTARLQDAQARLISNTTPDANSFSRRFATELEGLDLGNEGKRFSNDILAVDAQFRTLSNEANLSLTRSQADSFASSAAESAWRAVTLMDQHGREPFLRSKLSAEVENLAFENMLIQAKSRLATADEKLRYQQIARTYYETQSARETVAIIRNEALASGEKPRQAAAQTSYLRNLASKTGFEANDAYNRSLQSAFDYEWNSSSFGKFSRGFESMTNSLGHLVGFGVHFNRSSSKSDVTSRKVGRSVSTSLSEDSRGNSYTTTTNSSYK